MEKDESPLENLKERYLVIQKKHNLPNFEELNRDFSIEKIAEVETDLLVREVRKFVSDKFSSYLRFIEAIIHPVSSPLFVFSVIKTLGLSDTERLTEIYKKLAKREVELIELDVVYNEEKEVAFIKDAFKEWQSVKKELVEVLEVVKKNWDNKFENGSKCYFG